MDYTIKDCDDFLVIRIGAKDYERKMEELLQDLSEKCIRRQWKSKYNNYVSYDYAPFCIDGFDIEYTLDFRISANLKGYFKYLIEKSLNKISELDKLLLLETKERRK